MNLSDILSEITQPQHLQTIKPTPQPVNKPIPKYINKYFDWKTEGDKIKIVRKNPKGEAMDYNVVTLKFSDLTTNTADDKIKKFLIDNDFLPADDSLPPARVKTIIDRLKKDFVELINASEDKLRSLGGVPDLRINRDDRRIEPEKIQVDIQNPDEVEK